MKFIKKNFYLLSILILIVFVGLIVAFRQEEPDVLPLKNRIGGTSMGKEWVNTKAAIEGLLEKVRKNPEDAKSKIQLAQAYIQEARVTGDYNYYDAACIKLLNSVIKKEANNYEALATLATVYLSQHHFQQGLDIGKEAQRINPHAAFVYGVLTDGYVELGKYDSAVYMADSMCGIRPDLRSYSRVSYLREIYGDIPGAIEVMKMAVDAGLPGMEQTEWVRLYLGRLYEITGKIDTAEMYYKAANSLRPNYAYGLAALGRIEQAKKNYPQAITYFEQAASLVKDYSFGDELMDLYRLTGQTAKADSMGEEVIKLLSLHANSNDEEGDAGHYADKELAYVYLKTGDNDAALKHAQAEYKRRPDNIEVNEMMAWVYYQRGEFKECVPFIEKAMRTGSKNPVLLCRAGLIYCKNNQAEKGTALIQLALATNPYLTEDLAQQAKMIIDSQPAKLAISKS
ncbi:MAG: transposase [Chitinophagaceae bacterium]|nr:transposase [Chitinophagaceae bacterium]